ncbi:MAG: hypothetical protein ACRD0A_15255 [Acidimicrobiales bacterium]
MITTRPDAEIVRSVNLLKGRPPEQTGSITTTPARVPLVFDWDRLPTGITRRQIIGLMDDFFAMGPFGFRGPRPPRTCPITWVSGTTASAPPR